ncbi:hypothetical protein Psta_3668 [Pirellula staleyi DSM 6068]|uniref:Type II secretion system protein J n=1 Tax=Pirellula staleyi (strain ATCC 27377 / DSM 6068 / ICPB 4128) TaxID=530564 RepID=D2QZD5_PIRSD|nr:hypothetical protein Psta_3668 [Pirellula staleyi DSM 6068]
MALTTRVTVVQAEQVALVEETVLEVEPATVLAETILAGAEHHRFLRSPISQRLRAAEVAVALSSHNHLCFSRHHRSRNIRRAMTLLELILALALSVLVLSAVGMAIDVYFRMFDARRTNVEDAQLARALLRHMADDLKSAVQYSPPDLSGLALVAANGQTAATNASNSASNSGTGDGADSGSNTSGGTGTGSDDSGDSAGDAASGATPQAVPAATDPEAEDTGLALPVVGLYGTSTEFSVDVSKLPRVDQYQTLIDSASNLGVVDIPSDVKTVTYFVRSEESASLSSSALGGASQAEPSSTGQGRGLMRRELDRAVTTWAEMNGDLSVSTSDAKLLAEEVVSMQVQYFDGSQWLTEWNSDSAGGLPVAVEIVLVLTTVGVDPETAEDSENPSLIAAANATRQFRMVVHLPHAIPAATREATAAAEEEAAANSGSADAAASSGASP